MIELTEMRPEDLRAWLPGMFAQYLEDRVAAGEGREAATAQATAQQAQLFPGGAPAEGQHVMDVRHDEERVGVLWMGRPFSSEEGTWFVFLVDLDEAHRGKGLGRAAMEAAERWTLERGGRRISLNVFGPNVVARRLYDSLGYQVLATGMYKDL